MPIIDGERVAYRTRPAEECLPQPITKIERVPRGSLPRQAESLRPTTKTTERYCSGDKRARAIIDHWKFRADPRSVSIRLVSEEEWAALNG
jgi:hypothetical protein